MRRKRVAGSRRTEEQRCKQDRGGLKEDPGPYRVHRASFPTSLLRRADGHDRNLASRSSLFLVCERNAEFGP